MLLDTIDLLWTAAKVAATLATVSAAAEMDSRLARCTARCAMKAPRGVIGQVLCKLCNLRLSLWRKVASKWLEPWREPITLRKPQPCRECDE